MRTRIKIYAALMLIAQTITFAGATINGASNREIEEQCSRYTYNIAKPLLDFIRQHKNEFEKSDEEVKDLKEKLTQQEFNEEIIKKLMAQIAALQQNIETQNEIILNQKSQSNNTTANCVELSFKLEKCEIKFNGLQQNLIEKNNELQQSKKEFQTCQTDIEKFKKLNDTILPDSCAPFEHSPGIHSIQIRGYDPISVLCDSLTTGPGWIVIQQRIGGKESFKRDWNTYVTGFGSLESDFFLGLENIHRLTSSAHYELYIYLESWSTASKYAHYDHFQVEGKDEDYKLRSLGKYSGNTLTDFMRVHEGMKFSTFDRDNDKHLGACATYLTGGWWYKYCTNSFLGSSFNADDSSMIWVDFVVMKRVKMLIRKRNYLQ